MFRFTIRDVLWLMVMVAALAAWWADRSRLQVKLTLNHEAAKSLAKKLIQAGHTQGFWIPAP